MCIHTTTTYKLYNLLRLLLDKLYIQLTTPLVTFDYHQIETFSYRNISFYYHYN